MNINEIRVANLRHLIGEATLAAFADRYGLDSSYLSQILNRHRNLGEKAARKMEGQIGIDRGALDIAPFIDGEFLSAIEAPSLPPSNNIIKGHGSLTINQYDVAGEMGNVGLVLDEQPPGLITGWQVDEQWLRMNVPAHTGFNNLCIVTGFGSSMQPMYNPGDPLLMDRGVTDCKSDGIYFFRVGEHGWIKQLQRIPTATGIIVRAKSMNPSYDPFEITESMDFHVLGKILMAWRGDKV